MQLHLFAQSDKFTQPRVKRQSSQGDNALHSLLHNGYSTDQEKSDHLSLPGARVRKRFSVGKDAESANYRLSLIYICTGFTETLKCILL